MATTFDATTTMGLNDLPSELIRSIATLLQAPALNTLSRTCGRFHKLVDPFLYSAVTIYDLQGRKAFILAITTHSERYDLVKEVKFDYEVDENPTEPISDLSLAGALPKLETLYIHSPYAEPHKGANGDYIEVHEKIQMGEFSPCLRKCTIWFDDSNGEFIGGYSSQLLFEIARQPYLESMTIQNVEVFYREPQHWSMTQRMPFLEYSTSRLTELRIIGFDMDSGSLQWCLWKLDSLKTLELRLLDGYPPQEITSYDPADWVNDLLPAASTLEHLTITGGFVRDTTPDWDNYAKLRWLHVDIDWFFSLDFHSIDDVAGFLESDPSYALVPPNIETIEIDSMTSNRSCFLVLSNLTEFKKTFRPRLSKFILRHEERLEIPSSFREACKAADITIQCVFDKPQKAHYFWMGQEDENGQSHDHSEVAVYTDDEKDDGPEKNAGADIEGTPVERVQ